MSATLIRSRMAAVAVRLETVPGVDIIAGSPLAADLIAGDCTIRFNPDLIADPSLTGSLDMLPSTVGGFRPDIEITVPLRGSGAAATAPSWGRLMRACCCSETLDAVGVASVAATAGAASTVTLPVGFPGTAQALRGLPLIITGNPTAGTIQPVVDYTASRVATLNQAFSPILSIASLCQLPANVAWRPTSDEAISGWATVYVYRDGYRWNFTGCTGTVRLELTTGGLGQLVFALKGMFASHGTAALPAVLLAPAQNAPPRFVGGHCRLNGGLARVRSIAADYGINIRLPENPEAAQDFDAGVPLSRQISLTIDPLMDTNLQQGLFDAFAAGTSGIFTALLGTTPGNRFALTMPNIRQTANDPSQRDGLEANSIRAMANLPDSGLVLCQF